MHNDSYQPKAIASQYMQINSVTYSVEEFSLNDFFSQLAKGEYKDIFAHARLAYAPGHNEILKNLLSSGLVPVWITVKNATEKEKMISYKNFYLADGGERYRTLNPSLLPMRVKQFSISTENTEPIVLMMALLLSQSGKNMDSKNLVIDERALKPGEEIRGLLLFSLESMQDTESLNLEFKELP